MNLSTTEIINAELTRRGSSLFEWASERGLSLVRVSAMIEGRAPPLPGLILELSEAVGVSEATLAKLRTNGEPQESNGSSSSHPLQSLSQRHSW